MWWARDRVKAPVGRGLEGGDVATGSGSGQPDELVKLALEFGDFETACSYLGSRLTQMSAMCETLKAKNEDLKRCRDVTDKLQTLMKRFEKQHQELMIEREKSQTLTAIRQRNARLEEANDRLMKQNQEMKQQIDEAQQINERKAAIETPLVKARAGQWYVETAAKLEEYRLKGERLADICAQQQSFIEDHFMKTLLASDNGDIEAMPEGSAIKQYNDWKKDVDTSLLLFDSNYSVKSLALFGDQPSRKKRSADSQDGTATASEAAAGTGDEAERSHGSSDGEQCLPSIKEETDNEFTKSAVDEDNKRRTVGTQFPPPPLELSLFSEKNKRSLADRQKGALDSLHVTTL
ncbi:unnamed protein product [Amoebophrya sp. A25]|nr:unnamed protein product [Amoebophrya sp. A25]|eukprot:GSA25T00002044001.1